MPDSQTDPAPVPTSAAAKSRVSTAWVVVFCCLLGLSGAGAWYWYGESQKESDLVLADRALEDLEPAKAYEHLQRAVRKAPREANVPLRLADLAIQLGRLDEAESWIEQLGGDDPALTGRLQLSVAQKGMELSDAVRVERVLLTLIKNDPGHLVARQMLARLYLLTMRPNELRQQVIALDAMPDKRIDTDMLMLYCIGARTRWLQKEPREWLENALKLDPANAPVRAALAQTLVQSDEREAARKLLAEAPQSSGTSQWPVTLLQIEDLLETGGGDQAATMIGGLDPAAQTEVRYWIARGRILLEKNENKEALAVFTDAMARDPLHPEPVYRVARLRLQAGAEKEARDLFERAELLGRLNLAAKRTLENSNIQTSANSLTAGTPTDATPGATPKKRRREGLQEVAATAQQIGLKRLALLAYTALAVENPDLTEARTKIAELRSDPDARHPLVDSTSGKGVRSPISGGSVDPAPVASGADRGTLPLTAATPRPQFWDIAETVGLKFSYQRADAPADKPLMMNVIGGGIAVLDYDHDGWPDLFFAQGTNLPVPARGDDRNGRLFRNIRGQKFEEMTAAANVMDYGFGQGCAVADYDNDGFADLLVCHYGALRLYRNNGDGTFEDASATSGISDSLWSSSAAFGDFDRDGDLDLFVVHYLTATWPPQTCCLPVDYPRTLNAIWENRGDGTFVERTQESGIVTTDSVINRPRDGDAATLQPAEGGAPAKAYGLAVIVEDLDNDGWLDVYIANDMTPNFLFRNSKGLNPKGNAPFSFAEVGVKSGVAVNGKGEVEAGMGLNCADVDGDGWFDLFVTNFQEETNTFYRNQGVDSKSGSLIFSDDTARAGLLDLNPPKMGWGVQFIDALGTGRQDLFFLNSHLQINMPQTPSFFFNRGGGRFADLKLSSPYFTTVRSGRALAKVDWNRDLRPDLVATYLRGNVSLISNDSPAGHRVAIELVGRSGNRDGESARVVIDAGKQHGVYRVSRGGGFLVSNDKTLMVGLGEVSEGRWSINWPSGLKQDCGLCRAGRRYLVIEGETPIEMTAP